MAVSLAGEASPSGLQWRLDYPVEALSLESVRPASSAIAAAKSVECFGALGQTSCMVIGLNRDTIPSGEVAVLEFAVSPAVRAASIDVVLSAGLAVSPEGFSLPATSAGGTVTIDPSLLTITGVVDAAAFQPLISPGAIVSVFGNFAETTAVASGVPLGTELDGLSITFDGVPGALFAIFGYDAAASFNQANVQVPWQLSSNDGVVQVRLLRRNGDEESLSPPFRAKLEAASPGIFEFPIGSGQAVVTNVSVDPEDGVITGSLAQRKGSVGDAPGQPALVGGLATVWCGGLGTVTPRVPTGAVPGGGAPLSETDRTVRVTIGGAEAPIIGSPVLHPAFVGLYQINVSVPLIVPSDAAPIVIEVDFGNGEATRSKDGVTIAVREQP